MHSFAYFFPRQKRSTVFFIVIIVLSVLAILTLTTFVSATVYYIETGNRHSTYNGYHEYPDKPGFPTYTLTEDADWNWQSPSVPGDYCTITLTNSESGTTTETCEIGTDMCDGDKTTVKSCSGAYSVVDTTDTRSESWPGDNTTTPPTPGTSFDCSSHDHQENYCGDGNVCMGEGRCRSPSCGDGSVNAPGEQCDLGSVCSISGADCTSSVISGGSNPCGPSGGSCGPRASSTCTSSCAIRPPYCGDGSTNTASEECDAGAVCSISGADCTAGGPFGVPNPCGPSGGSCGPKSTSTCTGLCKKNRICGNGIIDVFLPSFDEKCDLGAQCDDGSSCTSFIGTDKRCGDGSSCGPRGADGCGACGGECPSLSGQGIFTINETNPAQGLKCNATLYASPRRLATNYKVTFTLIKNNFSVAVIPKVVMLGVGGTNISVEAKLASNPEYGPYSCNITATPTIAPGAVCSTVQTGNLFYKLKSVNSFLNPGYVAQTSKSLALGGRGFTPKYKTPFDDIICQAVISKDTPATAPDVADYNVRLVTTDAFGNKKVVREGGVLTKVPGYETTSAALYQVNITGWPNGLASSAEGRISFDNMNLIIDSIMAGRTIDCELSKQGERKSSKMIMDSCVHLTGPDNPPYNFKIVNMRASDFSIPAVAFVSTMLGQITQRWYAVDPFAVYKNNIAFYADLKPQNPSIAGESGYLLPPTTTSCAHDARIYFFYNNNYPDPAFYAGESYKGSRTAFINTVATEIPVHEAGHAFCKLDDEYIASTIGLIFGERRNCVFDPNSYIIGGIDYSNGNIQGCTSWLYYRPSLNSIMRLEGASANAYKFNLIDCGYCVMELNHQGSNYLPTAMNSCLSMDYVHA